MDGIESRFVIGPSNIQSGGVYVCTFQPGNLQAVAVKVLKLALFLTTCVFGSSYELIKQPQPGLIVVLLSAVLHLSQEWRINETNYFEESRFLVASPIIAAVKRALTT